MVIDSSSWIGGVTSWSAWWTSLRFQFFNWGLIHSGMRTKRGAPHWGVYLHINCYGLSFGNRYSNDRLWFKIMKGSYNALD